jgi:uncharacterized protein Yka (UPF0111/DUF47 family)
MGRKRAVLNRATREIKKYHGAVDFLQNAAQLSDAISRWKGADAQHFAATWEEFRETTIEPKPGVSSGIQNSFRPSVFFNLDEMGFGVTGWRFVPGLFVSVGLAATFLGLIAALQQTGESLQAGGDQAKVMSALTQLLTVASAKFIMSLTGLICSIIFTLVLRYWSNSLDGSMRKLVHAIERRMNFVSLEDLAGRQLESISGLRDHMQQLNHELIAAISAPLEKAASAGGTQVSEMVSQISGTLGTSVTTAIASISDRMEAAAEKLSGLAAEIGAAAEQFSTAAERTTVGLDGAARRLEVVSDNLSRTGNGLAEASGPILEAAGKTAHASQDIATSSTAMVETVKQTLGAEKDVVVAAAKAIQQQIGQFEARAAAYDGDLERAFKKFTDEISRSISEVEAHSNNVHGQYAEALSTLQAVIENARAFEPESLRPTA